MKVEWNPEEQQLEIACGRHGAIFTLNEKERACLREAIEACLNGEEYTQVFHNLTLSSGSLGVMLTDSSSFKGLKVVLSDKEAEALRRRMFMN